MRKRFWLRWGLVCAGIDILGNIIVMVVSNVFIPKIFLTGGWEIDMATIINLLYLAFSYPAHLLQPVLFPLRYMQDGIFVYLGAVVIISAAGYFIIGAIAGWIRGMGNA